jgi:hypothetical protein
VIGIWEVWCHRRLLWRVNGLVIGSGSEDWNTTSLFWNYKEANVEVHSLRSTRLHTKIWGHREQRRLGFNPHKEE